MNTVPDRQAVGSVPGVMLRGGTSRGLFLREADIPTTDPGLRDALILELFGSPDPLQLCGIGGGKSHLSKVMIVEPSNRSDADVDYTFAQVGTTDAEVDWSRNNGNLGSAVGAYAIMEGLVEAHEPETKVVLYNTNTGTYIEQLIPVEGGEPAIYGNYAIDGVPGTGAKIQATFIEPGGAVTGSLLPMGETISTFTVADQEIEASVVDSGTLGVAFRANDLGLTGTELPAELAENHRVMNIIEEVRETIRSELDLTTAKRSNPSAAIVSKPQSYTCSVDKSVSADEIDITARFISLQPHHAISLTGGMSLASSAKLHGTIPNEVITSDESLTAIGHPKGTIEIDVDVVTQDGESTVNGVTYWRTFNPVFHGNVYYRYINGLEALRE